VHSRWRRTCHCEAVFRNQNQVKEKTK